MTAFCLLLLFAGVASGCDLQCFLGNLKLAVPDLHDGGVFLDIKWTLDTHAMVCEAFSVGAFVSAYDGDITVVTGLQSVAFACSGDWAAKWGLVRDHGTVGATDHNSSFALVSQMVNNATSGLAEGVRLVGCNATVNLTLSLPVPDWLEKIFVGALNRASSTALCGVFAGVDDLVLSSVIQWTNRQLEPYIVPPPPALPAVPLGVPLAEMQNNSVLSLLDFVIARVLGPDGLNRAIGVLNVSSLFVPVNQVTQFEIDGVTLSAALQSVKMSGPFDSWTALGLYPAGLFEAGFHLSLAGPIDVGVAFAYNFTVGGNQYSAQGLVEANLSNLTFIVESAIFANATFYNNLTFAEMAQGACSLVGLVQLNMTRLLADVFVNRLALVSTAVNGTLERQFDQMFDDVLAMAFNNYARFLSPLINAFLDTSGREAASVFLNRGLHNMNLSLDTTCAPTGASPLGLNMSTPTLEDMGVNMLAVIVSGSACAAVLLAALVYSVCGSSTALAFAKEHVPVAARLLVPVVIMFCLGYQIVGWFSMSAILVLRIIFGGKKEMISPTLYEINLPISVQQAWQAGVYGNSFIIAFTQVVLPMSLLIVLICVWYIPEKHLVAKRRVQILVTFSAFSRFQLISGMMLVVYQLGYHFVVSDLKTPQSTIETFIVVGMDFWLFMGCCCLALLLCQYQLRCAREACDCTVATEREPSNLVFGAVLVSLVLTCGCLVAGLYLPSYVLEFKGLGGYVLSLIGVPANRTFSMIDTAMQLRVGWMDPNALAAYCLQISFMVLAIIVPCLQTVACFWVWLWPGKLSYSVLESASVWASMDVFVVAILASVLALTEYTSFMLGSNCDALNAWLVKYAPNALDESKCIDLTSRLLPGVYVLIAGMALMIVNSRIILHRMKRNGWDNDKTKEPLLINY